MAVGANKENGASGAFTGILSFIKDSRILLISSVLIFILSTIIAFRQEPRPDAYTQPEFPSSDWWKYPIEKNAFARLPVVSYGSLTDVFALPNSEKVWVAGQGGLIAYSDDGGKSWVRQYPPIEEDDVKDVNQENEQAGLGFSLSKTAYAGEEPTGIQRTPDKKPLRSQEQSIDEIEYLKRQKELKVIEQNKIPRTEVTPTPTPKPEVLDSDDKEKIFSGNINSIFFTDKNSGWAVGNEGTILHTIDGGNSWNKQESKSSNDLNSVTFTDSDNGWAVGNSGTILHTTDRGKIWKPQESNTSEWLYSVTFTDANNGWVVGEDGTILNTTDGGNSWSTQNSITPIRLLSVTFTDANNGWAVGEGGIILHTADGGKSWNKQDGKTTDILQSVTFTDVNNGWAVGGGTILHSTDGGENWNTQVKISKTTQSTDGGENWNAKDISSLVIYKKYPAPWYFLILGLVLAGAGFSIYRIVYKPNIPSDEGQEKIESIADAFASDKPIGPDDPDYLNFKPLANGISRFIRNKSTEPPLTIAITAPWGHGKSSIMNLLQHDLKNDPAKTNYTVWFNAWHHQNERNLLASLLENIYSKAFPGLWTIAGLKFRARFVWNQFRKTSFLNKSVIIAILALFIALSIHISLHFEEFEKDTTFASKSLDGVFKSVDFIWSGLSSGSTTKGSLSLKGFFGSFLTLFLLLIRTARQYKINPSKLVAGLSPSAKMKDFNEYLGFRHKFSKAFKDAIESLRPGRLVILIDDLDRCEYKNVLQVLESINFLSSSGECFIILGMDKLRVMQCVARGFQDMADIPDDFFKINGDRKEDSKLPDKIENQIDFAKKYLEKLINIEMPVPDPKDEQTKNLLKNERVEPSKKSEQEKRLLKIKKFIAYFGKTCRYSLYLSIAIIVGYLAFTKMEGVHKDTEKPPQKRTIVDSSKGKVDSVSSGAKDTEGIKTDESEQVTQITFPTSEEMKGKVSEEHWSFWAVPGLLLIFAIVFYFYRLKVKGFIESLKPPDIDDSPKFKQGLDQWHDLITYKSLTPRSIKRFLNRVRFLAMLQGDEPKVETVIEKLVEKFSESETNGDTSGDSSSDAKNEKIVIPEDMLVGFAAVENVYPGWFQQAENNFRDFHSYFSNEEGLTEHLLGGEAGYSNQNEYLYFKKN